jgi:hypothetical protein
VLLLLLCWPSPASGHSSACFNKTQYSLFIADGDEPGF